MTPSIQLISDPDTGSVPEEEGVPSRPGPPTRPPRRKNTGLKGLPLRPVLRRVTTLRGKVLLACLGVFVIGVVGLISQINSKPAPPRISIATAQGTAEQVRRQVLDSTRSGDMSQSLAPGLGPEAASALHKAPAYFLSVFLKPSANEAHLAGLLASEKIVFHNSTDLVLHEVKLTANAVAAGGHMQDLSAQLDGQRAQANVSGATVTVKAPEGIKPGADTSLELTFDLTPPESDSEAARNPSVALTRAVKPAKLPMLATSGLAAFVDWYPRLGALSEQGWVAWPSTAEVGEASGESSFVYLDVECPHGWKSESGGHKFPISGEVTRPQARYLLAGAKALPLVAMRNGHDIAIDKGVFQARGLSLDTFGPALDGTVNQAMYAKAVLSNELESVLWRDTVVVGLATGSNPMVVADNMILIDEGSLVGNVSSGPGEVVAQRRQMLFEGVGAEWWGGRRNLDPAYQPALAQAFRAWAAASVWGKLGGDPLQERVLVDSFVDRYRTARGGETPDVTATGVYSDFDQPGKYDIARAKAGLMPLALVGALGEGSGAASWGGWSE